MAKIVYRQDEESKAKFSKRKVAEIVEENQKLEKVVLREKIVVIVLALSLLVENCYIFRAEIKQGYETAKTKIEQVIENVKNN